MGRLGAVAVAAFADEDGGGEGHLVPQGDWVIGPVGEVELPNGEGGCHALQQYITDAGVDFLSPCLEEVGHGGVEAVESRQINDRIDWPMAETVHRIEFAEIGWFRENLRTWKTSVLVIPEVFRGDTFANEDEFTVVLFLAVLSHILYPLERLGLDVFPY